MVTKIEIDPLTRIEGHLAIHLEVESNKVTSARCVGEMFRGFETILRGRDPLDAQQITQRICGVCPVSHGIASVHAQEMAYNLSPPDNGHWIRNIILAANYIQSHITHFYHLSALDFIDIAAVTKYNGSDQALTQLKNWVLSELKSNKIFPGAPFLPRYDAKYLDSVTSIKNYLSAFEIRSKAHQLGAVFAGKLPHFSSIFPGGVTERVTGDKIAVCVSLIEELQTFIETAYLSDMIAVAKAFPEYFSRGKGTGNFLAFGVFSKSTKKDNLLFPSGVIINRKSAPVDADKIAEDVTHSLFSSTSGLNPSVGETIPDPDKKDAYSWIKSPRYDGNVMEVGPLARVMVAVNSDANSEISRLAQSTLKKLNKTPADLDSVMGRHIARAIECKIIADQCRQWIEKLRPDEPTFKDFTIPTTGKGVGLTEAPRGALGHWISIKRHKIDNYQCVVPTTWNCSPRDKNGQPGVVEQALVGTPVQDRNNPIEATRVVRSFDPCLACAVH